MATIEIAISRPFRVSAGFDAVWALLADTPATLAHYPKMQRFVDLGDDCWRWELQPTGLKGVSHQLIYSVRYAFDRGAGNISWTPLDADSDNARVRGEFEITRDSDGCKITLSTDGELEIPVPALLSGAVKPFVEHEFTQQIERFVCNLGGALDSA